MYIQQDNSRESESEAFSNPVGPGMFQSFQGYDSPAQFKKTTNKTTTLKLSISDLSVFSRDNNNVNSTTSISSQLPFYPNTQKNVLPNAGHFDSEAFSPIQLKCRSCLEDDEEEARQSIQKKVIQRVEKKQKVVGTTHLVKMKNGSLLHGEKDVLLENNTTVNIIPGSKIRSRRGPNQEEFNEMDKERNTHIYYWYEVEEKPGYYIREDALSEFAGAAKQQATKEPLSIEKLDQIIAENKRTPPFKLLKLEAIGHIVAGVLKIIAGIALGFFGAINALIGQIVGGVIAIAIGACKWLRANVTEAIGKTMNSIVEVYTKARNYVVQGKRGAEGLHPDTAKEQGDELELQLEKQKQKANGIRVVESILGLIGSVANCISGVLVACLGIVPNFIKALRSIAQLKKWLTNPKYIGYIIKLEAVLSGIIAIFGIIEGGRALEGEDKAGGEFGKKYYPEKDPEDDGIPDYKAGVGGIGAGIAGGIGVAGTKIARGHVTPAAGKVQNTKANKKQKLKEQMKIAKRIRKEAGDIKKATK